MKLRYFSQRVTNLRWILLAKKTGFFEKRSTLSVSQGSEYPSERQRLTRCLQGQKNIDGKVCI